MRHLLLSKGRHSPTASAPTYLLCYLLITELTQYWGNALTDNKWQNLHIDVKMIKKIFKTLRSDVIINP